jgi:Leucine Rich Repeat (LRR) protein
MKLKPTLGTTCSITMARHSRVVGAARLLPLVLLLTLPAVVQAQFNYTTNNGTITITGYTGPGGAVDIPSTINGLPVNVIGDGAFQYNTSLTSVTIPNSVTNIGYYAFTGCTRLTAITVDALNSAYSSVDGVLFNKNQTTLIQYPGGKAGSYTIPNSVTNIGLCAFAYCTSLTRATIPNSVTSIAGGAFLNCTSLTSVSIGNGVTTLGYDVFENCTSLTSVTIPDSVTIIGGISFYGQGAFRNCTSLTNVTLGNSVTEIGPIAFSLCTSLTSVTIPNSVTTIGDGAFGGCISLTSVTIGNSLTAIGYAAFSGCTSLIAITADALNSAYSSVDGVLFDKSQTMLIQYPGGKAGRDYTIPNSVTSIGDLAFGSCTILTNVTIPNSVTSIGFVAFSGCTSLTGVYFKGYAPSVGLNVFYDDHNVTVFYLPGTTGWGATFAGRPAAQWLPEARTTDADFGVRTNQFGFNIRWASDKVVVVEVSPNLSNPVWTPVSTNTLTGGSSYFSDPQWTNHSTRFYRLLCPVP